MMQKKMSNWVTISEESTSEKNNMPDKVQNKVFWGVSFVVLMIITAALLAPNQFMALLKGNLFDSYQGLQVIPPYQDPNAVTEEVNEAEEFVKESAKSEDITVVQPATDPVAIQVDPVAADPVALDSGTADGSQNILEDLAKELENFKKEGDANSQALALLNQLVASEIKNAGDLHAVAQPTAQPINAVPTTVAPSVQATIGIGQTQPTSMQTTYRVNTHRVQVSPYQMLQQNGMYMNAPAVTQQQYATQPQYNAQLSHAQGTPDSGPAGSLFLILAISLASLFGWKMFRLLFR